MRCSHEYHYNRLKENSCHVEDCPRLIFFQSYRGKAYWEKIKNNCSYHRKEKAFQLSETKGEQKMSEIKKECENCGWKGNCLYENAEAYGIKASECCESWKEFEND